MNTLFRFLLESGRGGDADEREGNGGNGTVKGGEGGLKMLGDKGERGAVVVDAEEKETEDDETSSKLLGRMTGDGFCAVVVVTVDPPIFFLFTVKKLDTVGQGGCCFFFPETLCV